MEKKKKVMELFGYLREFRAILYQLLMCMYVCSLSDGCLADQAGWMIYVEIRVIHIGAGIS